MGPTQSEQDLEIERLRDQLRRQNDLLEALGKDNKVKQQIQQLANDLSQYPPTQTSDSCSLESPSTDEFQLYRTVPTRDGASSRYAVPRGQNVLPSGQLPLTRPSGNTSASFPPMKRARTMSAHAPAGAFVTHSLARSASNMSAKSTIPFEARGPVSPPPRLQSSVSCSGYRGKANVYSGHAVNTGELIRPEPLIHNMEPSTGTGSALMDPAEFLNINQPPAMDFLGISPPNEHLYGIPELNITHDQTCATALSTCGSLTSARTAGDEPVPMTRENSSFDSQSLSGVQMLRVESSNPHGSVDSFTGSLESFPNSGLYSGDNSLLGKRLSRTDDVLLGVGEHMERSASSTSVASTKSNSSLKVRAKESLTKVNLRAANAPLMPKPSVDVSAEPKPAPKKDGKAAIAKKVYRRPQNPKVHCDQCTEYPEGFRGEHELRRHREAKHQGIVRKWVCVDPTLKGFPVSIPIIKPLDKCKFCSQQKLYGAYYNAAAHLRRTHFKEKQPRAKKNAGANANMGASGGSDQDRRGGKGGGDWPPMSELKCWMEERLVNQNDVPEYDDEDSDLYPAGPMDIDGADGGVLYSTDMSQMRSEEEAMQPVFEGFTHPLDINLAHQYSGSFLSSPTSPPFPTGIPAYAMSNEFSPTTSTATVTPIAPFQDGSYEDITFDMVIPH